MALARDCAVGAHHPRRRRAIIATRGLPLGIDFSGGTLIVVKFEQPVGEDAVRRALEAIPGDKVIQPYGDAGRTTNG